MNKWVTDTSIADEMLRGANAQIPGFKKLEESDHFPTLNELFLLAAGDIDSVIDLGCGAAEFGRIYSFFDYVGVDLPHVIEQTAKKKNPNLNYIKFNVYEDDYAFLGEADLILMNAFISELAIADDVLEKVLSAARGYIIIHRQKIEHFEDSNVRYKEYSGYLNKRYTCAVLSASYLESLLEKYQFEIVKKQNSSTPEEISMLLKKKENL